MKVAYGVWAVRSSASVHGAAEGWLKINGQPLFFSTRKEAKTVASEMNASKRSGNLNYYAKAAANAVS